MTLDLITRPVRPARHGRSERRRLAARDRATAHLAELHHIRAMVGAASELIGSGWVRHGWYAYQDGPQRPVTGACLVGAIVHAGGGVPAARSQPVQRALDLTWHALFVGEREPVRWCPGPQVRLAHLRDLTRWNDAPGRARPEVTALLHAARHLADAEVGRARLL